MLTDEQRNILSKTASEKYQLDINSTQISHLVLDNFECYLYFGQTNFIKGKVVNFKKFPLRMDFDAAEESLEANILKSFLKSQKGLKFRCNLSSVSHTVQANTLTISISQLQQLGIKEKLLG